MKRIALIALLIATACLHAQDKPKIPEVSSYQNVEVTLYLMSAVGQPATAGIPTELEGVVKQLRGMFSYKGYELIDTQLLRVRNGHGAEASGVVGGTAGPYKTISQVRFNAADVSGDERGRTIHIRGLKVGLKVPVPTGSGGAFNYLDTGINTDVDVREGQKIVVGKANMDGSDRASIVVLTAKVVD